MKHVESRILFFPRPSRVVERGHLKALERVLLRFRGAPALPLRYVNNGGEPLFFKAHYASALLHTRQC